MKLWESTLKKYLKYDDFIKQNIAINGAKKLVVYNSANERIGSIHLQGLKMPETGKKMYGFGALSDVHLQYDTAREDLSTALNYLTDVENVAFTCICGDLTGSGTESHLQEYKSATEGYPIYAISGNHEGYQPYCEDIIETYTGYPLYYAVTKNITNISRRIFANNSIGENDVFIFVGNKYYDDGELFTVAEMQWLYEILEEYRNKRCFLFQHVRPDDSCGNAFGIYSLDIWNNKTSFIFENLLKHYHNVIFFHGHSHLKFYLQYGDDTANIDKKYGCWSVHIPSITVPRDGDASGASSRVEIYAESEGYVVDVYENGIHLRGRDFVKGAFLPIASYWLNTTPQNIPANDFTDPTGTIVTA